MDAIAALRVSLREAVPAPVPAAALPALSVPPPPDFKQEGSVYQNEPLFHVEPRDYVPCILHLLLRIVELMFKHSIMVHVTDEDMAEQVRAYLQGHQVYVKKLHIFNGHDCASLLTCYPGLLDLVHGTNPAPELQASKTNALDMWERWTECWGRLSSRNEQDETNEERATAVERAARIWGAAFKKSCATKGGLYFHILMSHIPALIRKQGLESGHSV